MKDQGTFCNKKIGSKRLEMNRPSDLSFQGINYLWTTLGPSVRDQSFRDGFPLRVEPEAGRPSQLHSEDDRPADGCSVLLFSAPIGG